jgi:hypothetical protein
VLDPEYVVRVMNWKADVDDTATLSDWHTTAYDAELEPNVQIPDAVAVAEAVVRHVLGYVSEKPAAHAVQMPPAAPAVQVAHLFAQNAHVPASARRTGRGLTSDHN